MVSSQPKDRAVKGCSSLLLACLDLRLGSTSDPLSLALDFLGHLTVLLDRLFDDFVLLIV